MCTSSFPTACAHRLPDIFSLVFLYLRSSADKRGTYGSAYKLIRGLKTVRITGLLGWIIVPPPQRHALNGTRARQLMCIYQRIPIQTTFLYHVSHNPGCFSLHALECWQSLKASLV
jgi:hypothetical protein